MQTLETLCKFHLQKITDSGQDLLKISENFVGVQFFKPQSSGDNTIYEITVVDNINTLH